MLTSAIILLLDTTQGDKEVPITGTFCPTFVNVPQLNFNTFTNNLLGTVPRENCFRSDRHYYLNSFRRQHKQRNIYFLCYSQPLD